MALMTVAELIAKLKDMPQDAKVNLANSDGCSECNPEGMENWNEVEEVVFYEKGPYPHGLEKNVVVLS